MHGAQLPLANPPGDALMFLVSSVAHHLPSTACWRGRFVISTTIFLLTIEAARTALRFFGISVPLMEVAGGFALAAMGWNLLNRAESEKNKKQTQAACADVRELGQKVFYVMTSPITAGPCGILVMVTFAVLREGWRQNHRTAATLEE